MMLTSFLHGIRKTSIVDRTRFAVEVRKDSYPK